MTKQEQLTANTHDHIHPGSEKPSKANKDLNLDLDVSENYVPSQQPEIQIKKKIIRTAQQDGFFKTGVDVQEHEEINFEGTAKDAAEMFRQGQLTAAQIKELLQKRLKDDKIFGFENYADFNAKYFKKELVAFEDFYKIRQLKYARLKYNNRMGERPFSLMKSSLSKAGLDIAAA